MGPRNYRFDTESLIDKGDYYVLKPIEFTNVIHKSKSFQVTNSFQIVYKLSLIKDEYEPLTIFAWIRFTEKKFRNDKYYYTAVHGKSEFFP